MARPRTARVPDAILIDRWFRALDQRKIRIGLRDWHVQVTGIHIDEADVWIQMTDGRVQGASVLLRVSLTTSVDQAVRALISRGSAANGEQHPVIVTARSARRTSPTFVFH
jgi:hypothetical protein